MRYAISYVSTASREMSKEDLEGLLQETKKNNNERNITGILLYSDGNFFQILEGEQEEIGDLYATIKNDPRHYGVIKIFEKPIKSAAYETYKTEFISETVIYNSDQFDEYTKFLEILDEQSQQSARNILKAFMN
ncbi:MAG: BLUF domain-containing protein [Bacteroidota bacterium]|uniref:BLUF domain-containing protein n=1 Tax=Christiangramia sp. TaxID=1931228 RepID=UPI002355CCCC|nr:BLUF domain-containing protein [Bacteroidota bacterium]